MKWTKFKNHNHSKRSKEKLKQKNKINKCLKKNNKTPKIKNSLLNNKKKYM